MRPRWPGSAGLRPLGVGVLWMAVHLAAPVDRPIWGHLVPSGADRWQIFRRVVVPLPLAPLSTLAVLSLLPSWNDFLWPLYVLFNPENLTLPAGLATLRSAYGTDFPAVMAGAVLASIPVLIIYALAQRYIIAGVSRSGLKG